MTLQLLEEITQSLGIDAWGVAPVGAVAPQHAHYLSEWIRKGMNAEMSYLGRNHEVRTQPSQGILEGARSVVVCAISYYPTLRQPLSAPQVSKYAYGSDYHTILHQILQQLAEEITQRIAPHSYRTIVDTVPFLERYWATVAGLGFIGRNKNLIIPRKGSFVFLGELLTTLELSPTVVAPHPQQCGQCTRCIEACPTGALTADGLDARRCISYLTIEHKGDIPSDLAARFGNRLYGCDTCQDVCPYNHSPILQRHCPPAPALLQLTRETLQELSPETYRSTFGHSAATRAKYPQMKRNADIWLENNP